MARNSALAFSLVALLSLTGLGGLSSAQSPSPIVYTEVPVQFETTTKAWGYDMSKFYVEPGSGMGTDARIAIGGPFDYDPADDGGATPLLPNTDTPGTFAVMASWNVRDQNITWALESDRCDELHIGIDDQYDPEVPSTSDGKDWQVRAVDRIPAAMLFLPGTTTPRDYEAHFIEMENQVTVLGGYDTTAPGAEDVWIYSYKRPSTPAAGPADCYPGDIYGYWVADGNLGNDLPTASLDMIIIASGPDDYRLVWAGGDSTSTEVVPYSGDWDPAAGTNFGADGLYAMSDPEMWFDAPDPCDPNQTGPLGVGPIMLLGAAFGTDMTTYDSPHGSVIAGMAATIVGGAVDRPFVIVQDTQYVADGLTGKTDVYTLINNEWRLLQTIRPHDASHWYPSSVGTGPAFGIVEDRLVLIEHKLVNNQLKAYVYAYQWDEDQCDPQWTARPGIWVDLVGPWRVSAEEFVPHTYVMGRADQSYEFFLHSPRYQAELFGQDPYKDLTLQRDGVLSMFQMATDGNFIQSSETHKVVCPIVPGRTPQGQLHWAAISDATDAIFGAADVDVPWDNNRSFLGPDGLGGPSRFQNDEPGFYYYDSGDDFECEPPQLDIPCFYTDLAEDDLDPGMLAYEDEECQPDPECDDCRQISNVNRSAEPTPPGTTPIPEQGTPDPDTSNKTFQRDADGDGIADANDNCPMVYNIDQADGDDDGTGDACEGLLDNSNGGKDNSPILPNQGAKSKVESNGPGAALWIALLVGTILIVLLVVVARRQNQDDEQ